MLPFTDQEGQRLELVETDRATGVFIEQCEQLHLIALVGVSASTMTLTAPQWQVDWKLIRRPFLARPHKLTPQR